MRKIKILKFVLLTIEEGIMPDDVRFVKVVMEYGSSLKVEEYEVIELLKMSISDIIE